VTAPQLVAPFPYFGGKRRVASVVWSRLGNTRNYVEPFFGSGAVLLARPADHVGPHTETVNDIDGFIANFWRAVAADPDAVAAAADWPVNENDLHARHAWLVSRRGELTARLEGDPDFYDAKVAGWWVWGACAWIGSGWCSGAGPWGVVDDGDGSQLVHLSNAGQGINRQLVHLGDAGQGINRKLVHLGDAGRGALIREWFAALAARLDGVRVASGDWTRVTSPSVTDRHGLTGVFLDPPYAATDRDCSVYTHDNTEVAHAVRAWAIANGDNPKLRIAMCGYEVYGEEPMPDGWTFHRWKTPGGYGSQGNGTRGTANAHREVIWFSPHCLPAEDAALPLFAGMMT